MPPPRYRDSASVERRDEARRRVWPITTAVLAGGVALTGAAAGLAWVSTPGRAATTTAGATPASPFVQPGDGSLQPSDQAPSDGGYGSGMAQAVTGGS